MPDASRYEPIRLARILRTALALLVLAAAARAGGQDGSGPDVADLIAKLGHSEFEVREAATTALVALGERGRPALETALESADLETRLRIEAILRLLPVETESSTTSLEPQRVTLQVSERPLGEVVARLERESSVRFHRPLQVPEDRPVTLAVADMPLLEALDALSEAIGSRWVRDYGTDLIRFVQNPGARPLCRYFGPVRIAFTGVSRNASLQFGIGRTEQCLLQGQIDLEPGCRVLGIWSPPVLTEVRDDRETDLRPETPPIEQFTAARDRMSFHFSFGLRAPTKEAEKIRHLAGRLRLAIATSYQVVEFDCRQERVRSEGKTTVRLASNTLRGAERMVVVEIEHEPIAADRLATRTVADEDVVFLDVDGVEIEPLARPMRGSRADARVHTFRFPKDREPARLRARVLTGAKEEAIDFSFEDVPLP